MNCILQRLFVVIATSFFFLSLAEAPKPKYSYVYNEDVEGYELQTKWLVEVSQKGLEIEGFAAMSSETPVWFLTAVFQRESPL